MANEQNEDLDSQQTQTDQSEPGMVKIEEAQDEDLDAFLESQLNAQKEQNASKELQQSDESKPKTKQQKTDESQIKPDDSASLQTKNAEIQKLKERLDQQELFIQRQKNEIGKARKERLEAIEALKENLDDRFAESPSKALADQSKIKNLEDEVNELDQQEKIQEHVVNSQKAFYSVVDPKDVSLDDMVFALREDGYNEEYISNFSKNPFLYTDPIQLINLAKRAQAEKVIRELVPIAQQLAEENKTLKNSSTDVVDRLNKELKKTPSLNSSENGNLLSDSNPPPSDVSSWSKEQLEKFLEKNN